MPLQPEQGVVTTDKRAPELMAPNAAFAVVADFGKAAPAAMVLCTDLDSFSKQFPLTVRAGGKDVKITARRPPLPKVLARVLLKDNAEYQRLKQIEDWLPYATEEELLALLDQLQRRPALPNQTVHDN